MNTVGKPAVGPRLARDDGGPGEAFDTFARGERRALVAFAWSLTGDRAMAEDLAQEALEAAWHRWDQVGAYDKPGAWARRVVANRAIDRGRRRGRERRALSRWVARTDTTVESPPDDDEFWRAVRALPDRQAQAVALRYLEDLTVADIASVLDCAEGTVKVHLHRGRLALARTLGLMDGEQR